jgi:cytochrome c-type biogenesis protein CcmH/NrfF
LGLAYPWLDNIEIEDVAMRGESLVGAWAETGETGYAVTSYGRVVYYYPPEGTISDNIVSALAPMLVIIAVPGVVLGLLYIASPKLQKKYLEWSKPRRTAKRGKK